jgi:hypothetical protein
MAQRLQTAVVGLRLEEITQTYSEGAGRSRCIGGRLFGINVSKE